MPEARSPAPGRVPFRTGASGNGTWPAASGSRPACRKSASRRGSCRRAESQGKESPCREADGRFHTARCREDVPRRYGHDRFRQNRTSSENPMRAEPAFPRPSAPESMTSRVRRFPPCPRAQPRPARVFRLYSGSGGSSPVRPGSAVHTPISAPRHGPG